MGFTNIRKRTATSTTKAKRFVGYVSSFLGNNKDTRSAYFALFLTTFVPAGTYYNSPNLLHSWETQVDLDEVLIETLVAEQLSYLNEHDGTMMMSSEIERGGVKDEPTVYDPSILCIASRFHTYYYVVCFRNRTRTTP